MFQSYSGKKVFVTGHTGFKGSWLTCWLEQIGAEVAGYSLPPEADSHFSLLNLNCKNYFENINDHAKLTKAISSFKPDIVFHLAAQPLVRDSYLDPIGTYETNVIGSLKVYEASLKAQVPALVSITTDKVYENREWTYGYRECDRLGGHDPYSSSKACVEVMTDSFRKSFLSNHQMLLATTRAGNVIGGGDWSKDRIVPDLVRSTISKKPTQLRNPNSVRPWQHVLEPLRGYLLLGENLLKGDPSFARSFNFGPPTSEDVSVGVLCQIAKDKWPDITLDISKESNHPHEAGLLKLDISLAQQSLQWKPKLNFHSSLVLTLDWYRSFCESKTVITKSQIKEYASNL